MFLGAVRKFTRRKRWTSEEIAILAASYETATRSELAALFPDREVRAVECKANWLGLRRAVKPPRTKEEVLAAKRADMARRRAENPQAVREYQKRNYHSNREQNRAKVRAYYGRRFFWARSQKLSGVSARELASIWKAQRGLCALTGTKMDRSAEVDHIHPKALGGTDDLSNLRWVCRAANRAKRDLTDEEFLALCEGVVRWVGRQIEMVERVLRQRRAA